jgi:hypothetical protein
VSYPNAPSTNLGRFHSFVEAFPTLSLCADSLLSGVFFQSQSQVVAQKVQVTMRVPEEKNGIYQQDECPAFQPASAPAFELQMG